MEFKDYYGILGVEPSAGDAEIKTAYRRLARKYHPDVSKEAGAEDKFKAVNEAYEALRDPARRKAYDQLRAGGYRPGDQVRPPPGGFHRGPGGQPDVDFEEIFAGGGAGGGFSDFFESLFGRGRAGAGPRGPQAPGENRAKLAVPLSAVHAGSSVRISVNGRTLDVRVPKGIRPGQAIRLGKLGNGGGDLLLEVEYAADPQFEVDGRNASTCWRWRRGRPRWAPPSACRPSVARWSSRSPRIPNPGANCDCADAACPAPVARRMATRSWNSRCWPRGRTPTPSARPMRACAMRSGTIGGAGERGLRAASPHARPDQAAGAAPPSCCTISSESSVSLNGLVM